MSGGFRGSDAGNGRLMIERELKQAREQGRDVVEEVLANLESGGDRGIGRSKFSQSTLLWQGYRASFVSRCYEMI